MSRNRIGRKILSLVLAVVLTLGSLTIAPKTTAYADAAKIQEDVGNLTLNSTVVGFAGYEWYVIGYDGSGVYSSTDNVTLLAKNDDFGSTIFGTNNNYSGSSLQQAMVQIASGLPTQEAAFINQRTLVADDTNYPIKGGEVSNQSLWALSYDEYNAVDSTTVWSYSGFWWLRSPADYSDFSAWVGVSSGFVPNVDYTILVDVGYLAVRPAFNLDLSSALFSSAAAGGKSSATAGSGLVSASALTDGDTVKYTMEDDDQTLDVTATTTKSVNGTDSLKFRYANATVGENQYVSCVLVDSTSKEVAYYGKLMTVGTDSEKESGTLSIPLSGVNDGEYTLKIFSEQANDNYYTDFVSTPVEMTVKVESGEGKVSGFIGGVLSDDTNLDTVAGQSVSPTGTGTGTSPKEDTVIVDYTQYSVTLAEIIPSDLNATVELYSDSGYSQDKNADISLTEDAETQVYIKVIAEDEESGTYYKITIKRPAAPTLFANPAELTSAGQTSMITLTGTRLTDGIMLQVFDSTESAITGQGASAMTTGGATAQSADLTFPVNTSKESAVIYTVKASLDGGTTWLTPTVNVTVAAVSIDTPTIGVQGSTETEIPYDGSLTLTVTNEADYTDPTYQWYKDDELLTGETDTTLTCEDSGSYYVKVSDYDQTQKSNEVTLTASKDKSITSFSLTGMSEMDVSVTIDNSAATVTITVPYVTDVTSLTPVIEHTGASISPASGTVQNFTSPVTYTVTAQDNSTKDYTVTVNVSPDITPPTGEITIKDNQWTSFLNTITFGLFFKNSVDIRITGEDLESGVAEVEYCLSDETLPDTTDWNTIDWVSGREVSATANWKGVVYARITDNQSNQTVISSDGLIVYTDSQQDTKNISFTKTDSTDITANVTLNGNTVAGITNGIYTLRVDTDYTLDPDTGEITFKADYLNTLTEGNYTLTVSYHPMGITYVGGQGNEASDTTTITLTVTRASQDISGVSGMTKTYGDPDFVIRPSAQGSPVFTFESSDTDAATIAEDGTITITGAGETIITIKAAPTEDYQSAETSFKLTVEKAENTITNLTLLNKTYGDEKFTVSPQANENPMFSFVSSNSDVASIDQTTGEATVTGSGSAIITVSAAATANYKAASASFSVNVAQSDGQVITGLTDYNKTYGEGKFTLTPAGYEDPEFTYTSSNAGVAAVDHNTGEVMIVGAGIAEITVTAAVTGNYAETSAMCVVTVNKAEQTLSDLQNLVKVKGADPFIVTPSTNAAAENPIISYQSSDAAVIDVDGSGNFQIKGVGTATITVLAGETANYKSATATFDIRVLADTASLEDVSVEAEDLMSGLDSGNIGDGDGQYPQDAVDELQDAINKAKDVANDTNATQSEVDQAKEDLLKAIEDFQNSLIQVDFSRLDDAITQAGDLSESDYTAATWEVLEKALLAGNTVRKTAAVTQAEVDAATEAIFAAIDALESVYQFTTGFDTFTGSGSVTATVNAPYDKFVSLTVGGVQLDQNCYTVTEGSTVITLQETYLKTLVNGTYVVTAEFTDGAATTTLTVNVSGTKSVTGVTLDQSSAKVTVGKTLQLTATVTPSDATNKNLTWSSSDTSIATVDANGKITGIKTGSVIIAVTTEDGSYTATCKVSVIAVDSSDSDTSCGTQGTVKTGDNQNIWLWISILGASVLVLLGIYLIRKRKLSDRK